MQFHTLVSVNNQFYHLIYFLFFGARYDYICTRQYSAKKHLDKNPQTSATKTSAETYWTSSSYNYHSGHFTGQIRN